MATPFPKLIAAITILTGWIKSSAVFDPVPFATWFRQTKQEIADPSGGAQERICGDLHFRVDRIMVCFDGSGRLESVFSNTARVQKRNRGCDIAWPTVIGGQDSGGCGAFISADRSGNVREEFPAGCDNTGLEQPLHDTLLKWKLKSAVSNGVPVQVTALLGFPFKVHVEPAPPIAQLSNEQARKLATNKVDPIFPSGAPHGTKVEVNISVDDDGMLLGPAPGTNEDSNLFCRASNAVTHWRFSPYVENSKAMPFKANIIFTVP
jgi:hypothetical protein